MYKVNFSLILLNKKLPDKLIIKEFNIEVLAFFYFAISIATATCTVAPTIGLLPIPKNPIIST